MKKCNYLIIFTIILCSLSIFGCNKKQTTTSKEVVSIIPENEIIEETSSTNDLEEDKENTESDIYEGLTFNTTNISEDFTDYDYVNAEDIFTITSVETKTINQVGIIYVYIEAKGSIAGLAGTFTLELPYSEDWKVNDQCSVFYRKAYDDVQNRIIITDILYKEKVHITLKSRRERLAEEQALKEELESQQESLQQVELEAQQKAQQESEEAEAKKKAQQKAQQQAKKKAQQKAQQEAEAKAAQERAIMESINALIQ